MIVNKIYSKKFVFIVFRSLFTKYIIFILKINLDFELILNGFKSFYFMNTC